MKRKAFQNLKDKTQEELVKMAREKESEIVKIRQELIIGRHKNLKVVKNMRRDLAQIKTVLQQKELTEKAEK